MSEQKTSLVTGGAGFIGSHLCEALLSLGQKVFCVDNLITSEESNLVIAKKNPLFTFIRHDVTEQFPLIGNVDYVFHLASPASVPDYQNNPEETALVNSVGTRLMLQVARAFHARFLFTSTSEVYGDPKEHPQKETYWGHVNPIGIRACYDEGKRFGEMMTMLYAKKYHVNARIVRIFNTYGPRMRKNDGRVVSNFVNQALGGLPLTVYGDGTQTRSFCYVSDMVAGILAAMFSENTEGDVINLGNPEEYTVNEVAKKIVKETASLSSIVYKALPEDDPKERRPDIAKAKKLLDWEPKISFARGLQETITYYRNETSV